MTALHVAPCSHKAAKTAVERWHYSKRLPVGRMRRFGVWESGRFVGCVIFSRGASPKLGARYGLSQAECCELTRVAMRAHSAPVSKVLKICMMLLKRSEPTMRLIVSFADPFQGHHGGIYKAGGWHYTGQTSASQQYRINGRWMHPREASGGAFGGHCRYSKKQQAAAVKRTVPGKHRYIMWLDKKDRKKYAYLSKPYPCASPAEGPTVLGRSEGAEPILALHGGEHVEA